MSIEEVIRKYIMLANDERSRRIMMKKNHPSITNAEITTFEAEYRQIANWLQELKERREKESRREEVIRDPDEPYAEGDITPRGLNIFKPFLTIQVDKDMIQRVVDEAIDNLYYECKNCGQKMIPQRKEESK